MTLAIALRCADGLVLASDSRVTGGERRSADISEKFLQVNRDVGVMTYGLAVPGYRGIRALVEEVHENPSRYPTMATITARAQEIFQQHFSQYLDEHRQDDGTLPAGLENESVGFVVAGYDGNETSRFVVFSCTNRDGFQFEEELGTNVMVAQWFLPAWLVSLLDYPGMSVRHGLRVAVMLMVLTSTFERTVGGPIHLATVTLEEGFTLVHEREVAVLIQEAQPYLMALKLAWHEAWQTV